MHRTSRTARIASAIAVVAMPAAAVGVAAFAVLGGAGAASASSTHSNRTVTKADAGACTGNPQPANPNGHLEQLIANLSPGNGASVVPGGTIQFLYTDEQPFGTSAAGVANPTIILDGTTQLASTVTATSGVTPTYVDSNGGSQGTQCQDTVSVQLPLAIAQGAHVLTATVYDGDNDHDTYTWDFAVPGTPTPTGAFGALGLSAGVALMGAAWLSVRKRRSRTMAQLRA